MLRPFYPTITYFANRRRVRLLDEFRQRVKDYFADLRYPRVTHGSVEGDIAKNLRSTLNKSLGEARAFVIAANVATTATYLPPPLVGGYTMKFDFFSDMFQLNQFDCNSDPLIDRIDRAIGVYNADRTNALIRTFNPFWWTGRGLRWLARLPFMALAAVGFETNKLEQSFAGTLIRFIVWIATAAVTMITLYNLLSPFIAPP